MAWRRSVLLMAAMIMAPVALLHAVERLDFKDGMPGTWKGLIGLTVVIEFAFAGLLWLLLPRWTTWRAQSRLLALGWLVYFFVPFLVFLYPLAASVDIVHLPPGMTMDMLSREERQMVQATRMALGVAVGSQAMLALAPKIISLLQGLIRAGIATKTLFPGSTAPGWVLVLAAPLYIIIFYVFVLLPYQIVGSGLVVFGVVLVVAAKLSLVRAGATAGAADACRRGQPGHVARAAPLADLAGRRRAHAHRRALGSGVAHVGAVGDQLRTEHLLQHPGAHADRHRHAHHRPGPRARVRPTRKPSSPTTSSSRSARSPAPATPRCRRGPTQVARCPARCRVRCPRRCRVRAAAVSSRPGRCRSSAAGRCRAGHP
jgi:hypothetical protein